MWLQSYMQILNHINKIEQYVAYPVVVSSIVIYLTELGSRDNMAAESGLTMDVILSIR